MQAKFTEIYENLSKNYRNSSTFTYSYLEDNQDSAARFVERAVKGVIDKLKLNSRIRSDAYHFLLVNFHQMIVMPILMDPNGPIQNHFNRKRNPFYPNDFYKVISDDIEKILLSATNNKDHDEISGHAILDAVAQQYKNLQTMKFEIWG